MADLPVCACGSEFDCPIDDIIIFDDAEIDRAQQIAEKAARRAYLAHLGWPADYDWEEDVEECADEVGNIAWTVLHDLIGAGVVPLPPAWQGWKGEVAAA